MSNFDVSDDDFERQLTTMLHERAGSLSERVPVERAVITRARRRRTIKLTSIGSGLALGVAVMVVALVSLTGSPVARSHTVPATHGPAVHVTTPPSVPVTAVPAPSGASALPAAPLSARAASATAIADNAFVVWGGEGEHGERLMDGAWYDIATGTWHRMSPSPLPAPSYPAGQHFVAAQTTLDGVVIVSDGAVAQYTPRTDQWQPLPDAPLAKLDRLATPDAIHGATAPQMVLTGANRAGMPTWAALWNGASGWRWVSGGFGGAIPVDRGVLIGTDLYEVVHTNRGVRLALIDTETAKPVSLLGLPAQITASFVPRLWAPPYLVGGKRGSTTLVELDVRSLAARTLPGAYDGCAAQRAFTGTKIVSWGVATCGPQDGPGLSVATDTGATTPMFDRYLARSASDYAVTVDGRIFVWGGEDAAKRKFADGAVLTVK